MVRELFLFAVEVSRKQERFSWNKLRKEKINDIESE